MRSLEGQTALVTGGGGVLGRAIALALSARGVRIVVTGREERALGVTVGEVVHGGGKARHLAGDVRDATHLAAVVERAVEVFGRLDIVVASEPVDVECTFSAPVVARLGVPGRLIAAVIDGSRASSERVRRLAAELGDGGITCNAIVVADGPSADDAADDVAALAVFLCARAGARINGQSITVGLEARRAPPPA